jgi:hypothetical protein
MSTCHNNVPSGRKRKTAALGSPILSVMYRPGTHRATFQNCQYVHPPTLVSKAKSNATSISHLRVFDITPPPRRRQSPNYRSVPLVQLGRIGGW